MPFTRPDVPASGTSHSFNRLIAEARHRRGLTVKTLAAESGVSRRTIAHWESGTARHPQLANVYAVCAVLHIEPAAAVAALTGDQLNRAQAA